jgi:RimJ/RimL family protein N-acetyltransferase
MAELFAQPYEQSPDKDAKIVEAIGAHPWWYTGPQSADQKYLSASLLLHDPFNRHWEVWRGGQLVGIVMLSRIQWGADALLHFVFLDDDLTGKRELLLGFIEHCFLDLGFQRLSLEIPVYAHAILQFSRKKLGFRFEGEDQISQAMTESGQKLKVKSMFRKNHREPVAVILAAHASRRERSHWHQDKWFDVLCLRILRDEFSSFVESQCPYPSSPPSALPSPAA